MNLLEYQAKDLFRDVGIPVLPSQRVESLADLKDLMIPFPVVLKSQVYASRRGKLGGIKFAENTIDAIAAAQAILHLPILGQYPQVLLAETKYEPEREFYLAVTLDRSSRRPILLGSQQGGAAIDENPEHLHCVIVDQKFSPFYARRLALKMGLEKDLMQSVSVVVERMYRLFVDKDLDLLEINPLAVSSSGKLMALDGKVTVNDDALRRHPDLAMLKSNLSNGKYPLPTPALPPTLSVMDLWVQDGTIGVICNGVGLTLSTLDLLQDAGGQVASAINIGSECPCDDVTAHPDDSIQQGLALLHGNPQIAVILVNILSTSLPCLSLIQSVLSQWNQSSQLQTERLHTVLVLRCDTNIRKDVEALIDDRMVVLVETMDQAIAQTVALSLDRDTRVGQWEFPSNSNANRDQSSVMG